MTLEGGFFAIRGDDGVLYDPLDLPDAFRQDGLRVRYTLEVQEGVLSYHMVGTIVKVIDIAALVRQPGDDPRGLNEGIMALTVYRTQRARQGVPAFGQPVLGRVIRCLTKCQCFGCT